MIIQTAAAFLGSIGFAVFLKMKGKQIVLAGIGGGVTWLVYLLMRNYIDGYSVPYLIASIFVGIYAEIMARVNKAPATIFLTAAAVPLIPGGSLYYTMLGIVEKDSAAFSENGIAALTIALAISLGFVIVALSNKYIKILMKRKTR